MRLPARSMYRPLVAGLLCAAMLGVHAGAAQAAGASEWRLRGSEPVSAAIAVSRQAFPAGAVTAVLARADQFPDALAAGLLLRDGPLLLTPTATLHADTAAELERLRVQKVTILGGEGAVAKEVAAALSAKGYEVNRLAGASRIETAVAVAAARPASSTVILARAGASGSDLSQGFADALAAGAWSAAASMPVLLSDTATLSSATASYLRTAAVKTVVMVGGTAALSSAVEAQLLAQGYGVRRVRGSERAATAAAVASAQGFRYASDVDRVVLVPARGDHAWAAGFAAAALARTGRTAVLLAENDALPSATRQFVSRGRSDLICSPLVALARCDESSALLGLAAPTVGPFAAASLVDEERAVAATRTYTVAVAGGGPVSIGLAPPTSSASDPSGWVTDDDGNGLADLVAESAATIREVNGTAVPAAALVTGVVPVDGQVTFKVRADAPSVAVRPVVFMDRDSDGGLDVRGDGAPSEPAAVAGATVWLPTDAASGAYGDVTVVQAWPAFSALSSASATFRWAATDTFAYNSGLATTSTISRESFAAMISAGDTLAITVNATSKRFTIVRDIPAAPSAVSATATDLNGDGTADTVRVRWVRPATTDLAKDKPYTVERATREQGVWSAWAAVADGAAPSTVSADVESPAGEHRFRVRAANSGGDLSPPARPVLHTVGAATLLAPYSKAVTVTRGVGQPESNKTLDAGDRIDFTFSTPITLATVASVDLRDVDGTLVRLTRDVHASFAVAGEQGDQLSIAVAAPPERIGTTPGDATLSLAGVVVVEAAVGISNSAGAWNLPESGRNESEHTRTLAGNVTGMPAAIAATHFTVDAAQGKLTIKSGANGIAANDPFTVFDRRGVALVSGVYAAGGTTVTHASIREGERLYVVYSDLSLNLLPSVSSTVLVGSPAPALTRVEGTGDSIVLVWAEAVTLIGGVGSVLVFDGDDRLQVSDALAVRQAGSDRVLVDLRNALTLSTAYSVRMSAGLVKDAGDAQNDAIVRRFTTAAAAPTLAISTGPASGSTVTSATVNFTGTAADTIGVVTAVQQRVDAGAWVTTGITAAVPDDSLTWALALTLSEGSHTIELRAMDDNDAFSTVSTRTITVNAAAPTMTAAVAAIGANTILVSFSEAVTCPNAGAAAWSFDDTSGANDDGTGTAVTQTGLPNNQCRITMSAAAPYTAPTAGTLTYTPGASVVTDGSATPLAPGSSIAVTAA